MGANNSKGIEIPVNLGNDADYQRPFDVMLDGMTKIEEKWAKTVSNMKAEARKAQKPDPEPPQPPKPPSFYDQYRYYDAMNKVSGGKYQQQRDDLLRQAFDAEQAVWQSTGNKGALGRMRSMSGPVANLDKSMADKFKDLIMTSRFGAGGMMPLVNKAAAILGPEASIIVGALAGLGTAATAAWHGLEKMAESAQKQAQLGIMLGSGPAGVARLAGYGGMFDVGSAAAQLQSNIASGGVAGAYAAKLGINPIGGPFGDLNIARKLEKVLDDISRSRTFDEAVRKANMVGMPDLAQAYYLSASTRAVIANGSSLGRNELSTFSNFNATKDTYLSNLENYAQTAVANMPGFKMLNGLMQVASIQMSMMSKGLSAVGEITNAPTNWIENKLKDWFGAGKGGDESENTKALKENTRALKQFRETLGGGARTRAAIPNRIDGLNVNQKAMQEALDYGYL